MENIITRISIDLQSPATYEVIKVQQNDNNSRIIEVTLTNNGDPYSIQSGTTVMFEGHKGNGTSFVKACTYQSNIVTITLDVDILYHSGICKAKIVMYDGNNSEILSTPSIKISVQEDPCNKNEIVSDELNIIDQLINEVNVVVSNQLNSMFNDVASYEEPTGLKDGDFWTKLL